MSPEPIPPPLEWVAKLVIPLPHPPVDAGKSARGARRLIAFDSGQVSGPRLSGRVLPGGADVQLSRADGVTEIDAKYVIETDAGARVFVRNVGVARAGPDGVYFRTTPSFETQAPELAWLMQDYFVGVGVPFRDRVELYWYRVG